MREQENEFVNSSIEWGKMLLYFAWACAFFWLHTGERYRAFLHPNFWPLMVFGAITCLLFCAATLVPNISEQHDHGKKCFWIRGALLGLPLLFLWVIYGETLGTYAFSKRAQTLVEDSALLAESLKKVSTKKPSPGKTSDTGDLTAASQAGSGSHTRDKTTPSLSSVNKLELSAKRQGNSLTKSLRKEPLARKGPRKNGLKVKIQSSSPNRDSTRSNSTEKISIKRGSRPRESARTQERESNKRYSAKKLLEEQLPTQKRPLWPQGVQSATPLSGAKMPESVRLFSRLWYQKGRIDRYQGKRFMTEGEVFIGKGVPEGYFLLFRWFINCCTADAEPIGIIVRSDAKMNLDKSSWVRVHGRLEIQTIEGNRVPYIKASEIESIPNPPPEQRYLIR